MKWISVVLMTFLLRFASAQTFNIEPQMVDTLSDVEYRYEIRGLGFFDSTGVCKYELFDPFDETRIVYSNSFDLPIMQEINSSQLFYTPIEKTFIIRLGVFDSPHYRLHIWIERGEEKLNEIYFN
jgi:hypothetical protein